MKKYRSLVSLLFILISHLTFGQDYPVQVTTVLTPPYSLYLSDYGSPESNSLQVIIHLRELDRPEYRVKLRITIEGQGITIRTRPGYMPPALILQGGVPEMLSGADLSRYLNPDNLDFSGISRQEFMKKGAFPEGFYTFRIEVLDYVRNVVVSNPGFANAWMILNDPPLINFPSNHEKVIASDPQNVMFNWTPLHTGSPNAAFSTEYEFTLVELYPEGRNPNDAIRVANPIFVTTTPSTSLNYGVMEPMLIPGRRYAFRVKAFDTNKRDLFKNNGYSEVFVFQFGDACVPPLNIKSESLDPNRIKITWEPAENHTAFTIKYKKQGSSTWLEEKNYTNSIILPGLQGGTAYQYQVSGTCGTINGVLSDLASITTLEKKEDEFSCGAPAPAIEIKTTPLPEDLQVDDLIKTADFEVSISSIEKNSDGSYKGTGRAFLPWLNFATVRVKFSSIRVNEEYRVYDGIVTTVYSPNSRFVADLDLTDELDNSKDAADQKNNAAEEDKFEGIEIPYDGDIKDVTFNPATGEVIVTNEDGTTTALPLEKKENSDEYEDTRITDSNGDKWVIDKDGKVTQEPSTTAPTAIASAEAIDFTVQFAATADQNYGFDKKTDDKLGTYDVIKVQEQDYTVFWKSVETGHQDFINAQAPGKEEFPSIVGFKTSTGPAASMPGASKDQKQVIIIGQGNKEDQVTAYVKVKEEGKEEAEVEVGRINVATYDKVKKRLVIVPVNDASTEDGNSLTAAINAIYKQAVAEWEITVEVKFTIDQEKLTGLDAGESGMLSSFPDKCRDFNREFKRDRSIDRDAYYLFLIKGSGSSRSGFMPFKRKFGYIFTDNLGSLSLATTIAHELGHGAFRLRHTFSSEAFMAAQRSTNNLMDYKGGTELKKYQWDYVHDPESMNGWLQEDDESAGFDDKEIVRNVFENFRCAYVNSALVTLDLESSDYYTRKIDFYDGKTYEVVQLELDPSPDGNVIIDPNDNPELVPGEGSKVFYQYKGKNGGHLKFRVHEIQTTDFLKYIKPSVTEWNTQIESEISKITSALSKQTQNVDFYKKRIFSLGQCGLDRLSGNNKFDIIKILIQEWNIDGPEEQLIINIIRSIESQTNAQDFIGKIQKDESGFLYELLDEIDGDNYKYLHSALAKVFYVSKAESLEKDIETFEKEVKKLDAAGLKDWSDKNVFFWLNPGIIKRFTETGTKYYRYSNIEISDSGIISFKIEDIGLIFTLTSFDVYKSPFELVRLELLIPSKELVTDPNAYGTGRGYYYLPAINIALLINEQSWDEFNQAINLAFTFGTLGSGVLGQSLKTVVIEGFFISLNVASLIIDDYRYELNSSQEGKDFLLKWEVFNAALAIWQVSKVVVALPKAYKNLKEAYKAFKTQKPETAAKISDQIEQSLRKSEDAIDGLKEAGKNTKITPADFGVKTLAEKPELLKVWNETLKKLTQSTRDNAYKRYLKKLENGTAMTNDELAETFSYVRQQFKTNAEAAGFTISGEIHHWNYPKSNYPDQIVNPSNLTEPIDRETHEAIHRATSSGSNIFVDPISSEHQIPINGTPLD